MSYLQLFLSFLQIGAFSFGGGYAAIPLIQEQVVNVHGWLTLQEFTDLITISQMTPGPIAINSATFVGIKIGGIVGAIIATFGCILPSCIIVSLLAYIYTKYRNMDVIQGALSTIRPAVVAMIASAGLSMILMAIWDNGIVISKTKIDQVIIVIGAIVLLRWKKINPILVMLLAGGAKLVFSWWKQFI